METNLESKLRSSDPARNRPISTDGGEILAQILSVDVDPQSSSPGEVIDISNARPRKQVFRPRVLLSVAAALVVGFIAVGTAWMNTPRATAGLLPALITTPTGQNREEAIESLLSKARKTDDPPGFDEQTYQMKLLRESSLPQPVSTTEELNAFSPVSEYDQVSIRKPDGLHERYTTNLGIVSARTGERIPDVDPETNKRIPLGTITKERELAGPELTEFKKTHSVVEPYEIPSNSKELDIKVRDTVANNLAAYTGDPEMALFEVLGFEMQNWNPSQAQSEAVLELLRDRSDITFDGETKDRLGRAGLMFSIENEFAHGYVPTDKSTYRYSFIFDSTTGHLNAFEEVAVSVDGFPDGGTLNSVTVASL